VLTALRAELDWAGHPTVLVVEDVHWADEATLDVLRYLARRIAELPAVLILTYRDDELTREHPLQQLLGQASASGRARRLPLRSLSPDAVRWLSAASRVDAGQVFALTSGNPFFVTEVLAAGDGGRVPSTVVDAVLARARRLDAATQDALDQPHRPPGPHRDDPGSAAPHAGRRRPSTRHLHCPLLSSVNIQVGRVSRPHPGRLIQALCSHRQAGGTALDCTLALRSGGIGPVSSEGPQPDLAALEFLYQLGEIAEAGGDIRERLFSSRASVARLRLGSVMEGVPLTPNWSSRPAGNRRGATPILTVAQFGWSLGRAVARSWRGEGRATLCGDPQGGGGQALVAPLLPGEPPHQWPVNHQRPLQPRHLVLGEVALNGGRGRVASHR